MKSTVLTKGGYKKLEAELENLKVFRRHEIAESIRVAREQGDLRENAEYDAAKEEQRQIELRIEEIEYILGIAKIVPDTDPAENGIHPGCHVTVLDTEIGETLNLTIVGTSEVRSCEGYISIESPLGKALLGRMVSDLVHVQAPIGIIPYRVLSIG